MLKYRKKEMADIPSKKAFNQLKKDAKKYNIPLPFKAFDLRRNDFKKFVTEKGGIKEVYDNIKEMLNEIPQYKKQTKIRTKQIEVQKRYNERIRKQRYIGNINITFQIEEDRVNPIDKTEISADETEYFKFKSHKKDTIYSVNVIIRFDEIIAKKDIDSKVSILVENRRRNIFNSDNYIIRVDVLNLDYDINAYNKGIETKNLKMKDVVYNIEGYDKQDWNTNRGMCVIDYLTNLYGNVKGLITVCTEQNLIKLFGENSVKEGISTDDIYNKFTKPFDIAMYAYDVDDNCFLINKRINRKTNYPALMFKVCNNHFYPIPENKRLSFAKIASILNNDSELYNVIKEEEKEKLSLDVVVMETRNPVGEMVELMNKYQTIPQVDMKDGNIVGFKINNTKYAVNQNIALTKEIAINMGLEYTGQTLGTLIKIITGEMLKSCPNPLVNTHLMKAKKNRTFCGLIHEKYTELLKNDNTIAFDINKCYSSVLKDPLEDWILIDFNDDWHDYHTGDKIELGLYQVITDDMTLFKGSNIYSSAIICKAMQSNIHFEIAKKLICQKRQDKDLFIPIIHKILQYSNHDEAKYKLMLNMITGMLGKHKATNTKCFINKSIEHIFNSLNQFKNAKVSSVFVQKLPNTDYKLFGYDNDKILNETNIPMYIQIIDQANIKVFEMAQKLGIANNEGLLIGRKTDCNIIYYKNGKFPSLTVSREWGAYRKCAIPDMKFVEEIDHKFYDDLKQWREYGISDSDRWKDILQVCLNKNGLLLNASAGRGKSYVAKQISKELGKDKVIRLAPTNKAALNIKGMTIHKFLKMDKSDKISSKTVQSLRRKDIQLIIIDEISMIGKELWKRLVLLKKEINIPFLLLGDDKQLPPVENECIDNYFNHNAVKYLANYRKNTLTVCKRFDERLEKYLNNVNNINTLLFPKRETTRNICYINRTRKAVNKYWNEKLRPTEYLFIQEDDKDEYTQDMYIYKNLPVIARKTVDGGAYCVNNETFEVIDFDNEKIYLYTERPNEEGEAEHHSIESNVKDFKDLFSLNYCSTCHKAQGETIKENFTIYDWKIMSEKCKYTALSRATNPDHVTFANIDSKDNDLKFRKNIDKKINSYKLYDDKTNIDVDYVVELFYRQNGECCLCGCMMKTINYKNNDSMQFSIDRINSSRCHTKDNIQLTCWNCNRGKMNRL